MMNDKILVYVEPFTTKLYRNRLFGENGGDDSRKDVMNPFVYLKKKCSSMGIELRTADYISEDIDPSKLKLYYSFGSIINLERLIERDDVKFGSIYLFEPPIRVLPKTLDLNYRIDELNKVFRRVYLTCDVENINKIYRINLNSQCRRFSYPQSYDDIIPIYFHNEARDFLVMINSYQYSRLDDCELYSERIKAALFFIKKNKLHLYGHTWSDLGRNYFLNVGISILWGIKWMNSRRFVDLLSLFSIRSELRNVYPTQDKYQTLSRYRFALCFESMELSGFITEKIFDCFFSGTIPIYMGSKDISLTIPREIFVDMRSFNSYNDLYDYIVNMTDEQYKRMRSGIQNYLRSDLFYRFSRSAFADEFISDVKKDYTELMGN